MSMDNCVTGAETYCQQLYNLWNGNTYIVVTKTAVTDEYITLHSARRAQTSDKVFNLNQT